MAPQVGFEPTTDRLTADSSTTELLWINKMERVMGIEPTTSAWKAEVLPLNYTRLMKYDYGAVEGIEPRVSEPQSDALTTSPQPPK